MGIGGLTILWHAMPNLHMQANTTQLLINFLNTSLEGVETGSMYVRYAQGIQPNVPACTYNHSLVCLVCARTCTYHRVINFS